MHVPHLMQFVCSMIIKIEASNDFIKFQPEREAAPFMRTMAFVETRDGTQVNYNANEGGLWNIDQTLFLRTQKDIQLSSIITRLNNTNDTQNYVGPVNWQSIMYIDLSIPLYSGLAVRMLLQLAGSLPVAPRYPTYWNFHFKGDMSDPNEWNNGLHYLSNNEGMQLSRMLYVSLCLLFNTSNFM